MAKFDGVDEAVIAGTTGSADASADQAPGAQFVVTPTGQLRTRDGRRPEELGGLADYRVTHEGHSDRRGAMQIVARVTAGIPGWVEAELLDSAFRGPARHDPCSQEGPSS